VGPQWCSFFFAISYIGIKESIPISPIQYLLDLPYFLLLETSPIDAQAEIENRFEHPDEGKL